MPALLDDMAVLHDQNHVRLADGRQTMRDDEARAPPHHRGEHLLDLQLGARVDGAGRLVEDQHRRQRQHEPRDAEQLPLSGGESCARVGQGRIIALRQARDEAVGMGGLRRGLDLGLRGLGPGQRDVLAHRAGLEPGVLQDHAEILPEAVARDTAHIVPVDGDRAAVHVVKAHEQIDERRLAAARRADDGDALAGADIEVHILEQRRLRHVAERHMLQRDAARHVRERFRIRRVGDLLRLVHEREDTSSAGDSVLQLGDNAGNFVERLGVLVGIAEENRQAADRDRARDGGHRACEADTSIDHTGHKARDRVRQR